jgi:hypothetical protein
MAATTRDATFEFNLKTTKRTLLVHWSIGAATSNDAHERTTDSKVDRGAHSGLTSE